MSKNSQSSMSRGVWLIDRSTWYIVRVIEEFNRVGVLPTVEQIEARTRERKSSNAVNYYLGIGRSVRDRLQIFVQMGFCRSWDVQGVIGYQALPAGLKVIESIEAEPNYWINFHPGLAN